MNSVISGRIRSIKPKIDDYPEYPKLEVDFMAVKIEFTRKDGTRDSMVLGSQAMAEKIAKTLKNATISQVRVHAPVVHSKAVQAGTETAQQKSANRFYKGQKQLAQDVKLVLQEEMTENEEAEFFASCMQDGLPEWQAQKALREAKRELKRKSA